MVVVRPVRLEDLEEVVGLLEVAGHGMTSLPKDAELLRRRVLASRESFSLPVDAPGGESYLLVLEDRDTGRVAGTCGMISKVGGFEPFYSYRIETRIHQSAALGVRKEISYLRLAAEHSGPTEIGSLFLLPEYRAHGVGRLLSLARFLYMAEEPARFEREVIAEMRGVVDDEGHCPFWDAIGRHFFDLEFPRADYLSVKNKRFIAELMPTHPIYLVLLPEEARAAVGRVHPQTVPALRLLEEEGFRFDRAVDIFDGGPIMACPRAEIRTVRESRTGPVVDTSSDLDSEPWLLAGRNPDFRACLGRLRVEGSGVVLDRAAADVLGLGRGDRVRWAPVRGRREEAA